MSGLHLPKNQKRLPSFVIQSVLISNSISTLEAEVELIESRNIVVFNTSSHLRVFTEIGKSGVKSILKEPSSIADLSALKEKFGKNH
ncbi:MAG: hypothetical protein WBP84_00705 [Nitrososphaeraceae archaeon]